MLVIYPEDLVGKTLGEYHIDTVLDRAEVAIAYQAWQSSLRRDVVVKVLVSPLLNDPAVVQRFQEQARMVEELNHPNIVTLYEVGTEGRYCFLVTEYVAGQSLENLISQQGKLSLEEALDILDQIADALDYAHERAFVHHDFKSANILLSSEGRVAISDFGITQALAATGVTNKVTSPEGVLGSPAYMSPEQITGEQVDYRSDLYSLGIVAYEMLSGRLPFGETVRDRSYQLDTLPPDVALFNTELPLHIEPALRKMLARQPSERFHSAHAFVDALKTGRGVSVVAPRPSEQSKTAVMEPGAEEVPPTEDSARSRSGEEPESPEPPRTRDVALPPQDSAPPLPVTEALQPVQKDGKRWGWLLWAGLAGWVLLFLGGIVVLGLLLDLDEVLLGQEEERGRIAFVSDRDGNQEIYVMNSDGSEPYNLSRSPSADYWPHWSPDGTKIVFHLYQANDINRENGDIYIMDADGSGLIQLTEDSASEKFPSWSPDGERIVFVSNQTGNYEIYTMSNDSSDIVQITDNPALDYFPSWTPDGRILFESDRGGDNDIYVIDPDGRNIVNLTNHPARDTEASWSPDGRYVAFSSDRSGQLEVWLMDSDGSNLRQLTEGGGHQPDWSSDSTKIVFVAKRKSEYENIFVIDLEGTYITRLTTTPAHDFNPCWISP